MDITKVHMINKPQTVEACPKCVRPRETIKGINCPGCGYARGVKSEPYQEPTKPTMMVMLE